MTSIALSISIILGLVACSAFFSGSETALTAVSKTKMHSLEKEGSWRARIVNGMLEQSDRLIGALLLGNNLVNILASAIATKVMVDHFGDSGVVYATVVMTLLVLIFAEVLPKTYALFNSDRMALAISPVIRVVVFIFAPITAVITRIVRGILHLFGVDFKWAGMSSIEELRGAIDMHRAEGELQDLVKHERNMLRSILDLADVTVEEIMTHRKNVEMIDAEDDNEAIVNQVLSSNYTRLPIYDGDPDNIVGIIHGKHLMRQLRDLGDDADKVDMLSLVADAWFIPETTTLFQQLHAFRERKEHFAVVVDEYGALQGVVTLEDILEEIVGEIDDEYDEVTEFIRREKGSKAMIVDGVATIRDLNREFEWNLPDKDYATVGGLLIHESRTIPAVGQTLSFYGFRFEVLEKQRNQLMQIKVLPPPAVHTPASVPTPVDQNKVQSGEVENAGT